MNYDSNSLPNGIVKVGETPFMDELTVRSGLLKRHKTPIGRWGYLVVDKGTLHFVWEDEPDMIYTADSEHPIVITPERFHHVEIVGPVSFKVEFFKSDQEPQVFTVDKKALRPGQEFLEND